MAKVWSTWTGIGLTEAILPVAEAAATVRLDCRKAFLNIVMGVQRSGRVVSLKERCNWGEGGRGERIVDGWKESFVVGVGRILRTATNPSLPRPHQPPKPP